MNPSKGFMSIISIKSALWTLVGFVTAVVAYKKRSSIWSHIQKARLYSTMVPQLYSAVRGRESTFTIWPSRKAATITYQRNGETRRLIVPFNARLSAKMTGHRAFLIRNNAEVEITQEPDVPYLVTAEQLGGTEIRVVTDEETRVFPGSTKVC